MKYCIVKYSVKYKDGSHVKGYVPYRGTSLDSNTVELFVKGYFVGSKSFDDKDLEIEIDRVYDNPREWLDDVKNWETFLYLRRVNNFAGDLMAKYYPDEKLFE